MSEWPKTYRPPQDRGVGLDRGVEVVPADLARELYESAKAFYDGLDAKVDAQIARSKGVDVPTVDTLAQEIRFKAALARYEQEVGE